MAFVPPARVPRKNRLKNPVRVSFKSRSLARVVDLNPAIFLACSRSITLAVASSFKSSRSRSVRTMAQVLFPGIKRLLDGLFFLGASALDFCFDFSAQAGVFIAGPLKQVVNVGFFKLYVGNLNLLPWVVAAFDD